MSGWKCAPLMVISIPVLPDAGSVDREGSGVLVAVAVAVAVDVGVDVGVWVGGTEVSVAVGVAVAVAVPVAVPAALGLVLLSGPLLTTLFFGGAFDATDVTMATASLIAYAAGLLGFGEGPLGPGEQVV